ncbi:PEGA domain protein [Mucisphaera calidilacus]|uniref:PEGA domain protein n=2 Tax=Mucisphaera calidilacus TaxID=2527982 RepID=A0A518BYL2_9BACT|nr:PEGA domain protein [Mucisphaera calidilacus]
MLSLVAGGCVRRTITITSEPSGALVHLNDREVGRTPLSLPFTYYGVYDVRLEQETSEPLWTTGKADPPWWAYPGPDLIAEFIPGLKDEVAWHYELTPAVAVEDENIDAVNLRARQMRARLDQPISDED